MLSRFYAIIGDVWRRPLDRLAVQSRRERLILQASPDGVLWVNSQGEILLANPAAEVLTGYCAQQLVGQSLGMLLPAHSRSTHARSIHDFFASPQAITMGKMDIKLLRSDGRMLLVDIALAVWEEAGERQAVAYIRDLSERMKYEESLHFQATHDELTGLPNRWLFHLQLNQALARAGRTDKRVAVMLLDLDNFKTINDSFGHATGDALLVQVSERMRTALRKNDTLARMGGDEFAVLLTDLADAIEAMAVITKLLNELRASYRLADLNVTSSASIGLAVFPNDASDGDTLLRYADMAMYQAKAAGRGTYAFYSDKMDWRNQEDLQMFHRLELAIGSRALALHYQPMVDVVTGRVVGAEALLRWCDPVLGRMSPAEFLPLAEATGMILALLDWVLETACRQIAAWAQAGTPLRVAVNLSAQQFQRFDLPEKVRNALQRTGAQAQWLDIEIAESSVMKQPEQAGEQLKALAGLGCRIVLDDFGKGFSSLSHLAALPVHVLKIDRTFVDGIPHEANDVAVTRAVIALARSLGMALVAKGVETDVQLTFLRQHDCEAYQGWLFAEAMPDDELSLLLSSVR